MHLGTPVDCGGLTLRVIPGDWYVISGSHGNPAGCGEDHLKKIVDAVLFWHGYQICEALFVAVSHPSEY